MNFFTTPNSATKEENLYANWQHQLRQAAWRRNLRAAAVLCLAVSGGIASSSWLATTAGSTFIAIAAWRYKQWRSN